MSINNSFSHDKIQILKNANKKLCIGDLTDGRGVIFVYCPAKVGSTSLVSYIRLYATDKYSVVHLHDEIMLKVLTGITGVTIKEIIEYNAQIGREVWAIDVYRTPIERKMSTYFEEISSLHFNNTEEAISKYKVERLIDRFNLIYPYVATGDHYMDKYGISESLPGAFDFDKKYLLINKCGVKYLKLRLADSVEWGSIMSELLRTPIKISQENETKDKAINMQYDNFKTAYKLPLKYFLDLKDDKYLTYFCSLEEREAYLKKWSTKVDKNGENKITEWSQEIYNEYIKVSSANSEHNNVKYGQYKDTGCQCNGCKEQRVLVKKGRKEKVEHLYNNASIQKLNIKNAHSSAGLIKKIFSKK